MKGVAIPCACAILNADFRGIVLRLQTRHEVPGKADGLHRPDALTATPDVLPGLGIGVAARAEVHLGRIPLR